MNRKGSGSRGCKTIAGTKTGPCAQRTGSEAQEPGPGEN